MAPPRRQPKSKGDARHAKSRHFLSEARGPDRPGWASGRHRRRQAPCTAGGGPATPVEAGHAGGHRRFQAGAHRTATGADAAGQAAARQAEGQRRLEDRALCGRRSQRAHAQARRQGNHFRLKPSAGQGARHRHQGRQARGEGDCLRSPSAERHRPAQRHALHRRALANFQDREDRGQSRQPAEAHRHPGRSAEGRAARLEVPHRRPRREALLPDRRALQHLPAVGASQQDLSRRARREGPRGLRLRHPPDRRNGLASDVEAALLLRQLARLAVGGRAGGQAQSRHPARQGSLRLSLLPPRQLHRPGIRLGAFLQRVHRTRRPGRAPFGRARLEVLHGKRPWR